MAFVNEYASEEDIKRYELDKIWLKYHPGILTVPSHVKLRWTIDRESDSFLMDMKVGREEEASHFTFVLYSWGELLEFKVEKMSSGSRYLYERPFRMCWRLVGVWPSQLENITTDEIMERIKPALVARGYDGVRRQVPDTVVEFNNF